MDIEMAGISTLARYISRCEHLKMFPSQNDKTPMWDGEIYLYGDKGDNKINDKFLARIPIQVKSKKNRKQQIKSYSVKLNILKNYQKDGGVLFFVINVTEESIFYAILTPMDITKILLNKETQKSINIDLKRIPEDKSLFESQLFTFFKDCQMQGYSNKFIDVDKFVASNGCFTAKVFGSRENQVSFNKFGIIRDVFMYIKKDDDEYSNYMPLGNTRYNINIIKTLRADISINGTIFFRSYKEWHESENTSVMEFGNSFTIRFINGTAYLNYESKVDFFTDYETEVEFLYDLSVYGILKVGNLELSVIPKDQEFIASLHKFCKDVKKLFEILHIKKDLNVSALSDNDYKLLGCLISSIVYEKELHLQKAEKVIRLNISNIQLLLWMNNDNDKSIITDFFSDRHIYAYKLETGEHLLTTPFSCLTKEDFLKVSNIDYENIVSYYQSKEAVNSEIHIRANLDMLNILTAYDECRNERLLFACEQLSEWILSKDKSNPVFVINKYQIVRRKRELNDEEQSELYNIAEHLSANKLFDKYYIICLRCACSIILGEFSRAKMLLKQLPETHKNNITKYPIYNLLKDSCNQITL